jgi:hypothetical protein
MDSGLPLPVETKAPIKETSFDKAADSFMALLFPPEVQDASTKTPEPDATPAPEAVEPEPVEPTEPTEPEPTQDAEPSVTEPTPPKRSRKLKLDGKEIEVDEDEAYQGYLRQADYTRKTQQAADLRKQAEAELAEARKARTQYAEQLAQAQQTLDTMVPGEPNWADLRTKLTPEEFSAAYSNWTAFKGHRDKLIAERERVRLEAESEAQKQREKHITEQYEQLQNALPEWRDDSKAQAGLQEIADYLVTKGWSKDRIRSVVDADAILTIRNAMLYDRLQSKLPASKQAVQGKLKTAPAGSPSSKPGPTAGVKAAREKLAKSGKIEDAANYFLTQM